MSLNVADLVGTLKIDKTAWSGALRSLPGDIKSSGGTAEKQAAKTGASIAGRLTSTFGSTVAGGAVVGAVAGVFQAATNVVGMGVVTAFSAAKAAVFDFNSTLENADIGFTTMLGSGAKSRSFLDQLKAFAKATPFEFQGLVQNAQLLMGMGVKAKEVIPTLTALGDSTASVGGDATKLNQTILAWGQTVSKGTLSMDNMNQLLQGGMPQALKILASQYGVTTGKMVEMISTGKVQAEDALPKLIKGIEKGTKSTAALGGMMDKQSHTFSGALSNISDGVQQTLAGAFKPLFDQSSEGFQNMATWLSGPEVSKWGSNTATAVAGAIGWFKDAGSAVTTYLAPILKNVVDEGAKVGAGLVSAWGIIGPPIQQAASALVGFLGPLLQSKDALPTIVAAIVAYNVAMKAYAAFVLATKIPMGIAIAQQWLMNAAMAANPIGIVVAAIAGLVAGLVIFFTQTKIGQQIWAGFVGFLTDAWNTMAGVAATVVNAIIVAWNAVAAWFKALPQTILGLLQGAGQWLLGVGKAILVGLASGIALQIIAVKYLFTKFPGDLLGWIGNAAVWLVDTGKKILKGMQSGIVAGFTAVVTWFGNLPSAIGDFFSGVGSWITHEGKDLLVGFAKGYIGFWSSIASWFLAIPGKIGAFFAGIPAWLEGPGRDLLIGFARGYVGFWGTVGAWFGSLPGKIGGFFAGIGGWLYDSGVNLVTGLMNGVKSLAGTIGKFFLDLLPGWIRGPFEKAMGIASPSKVFKQLGKFIIQGLAIGLTSSKDDVTSSMDKVIQYVKDGYDKISDTAKAARKKLTKEQRQWDAMSTKQRKSAAGQNLADTIAENKAIIAAASANKGGKAERNLINTLKSDNNALADLASKRDGIADRLADANDKLKAAQDEMADYAANVQQGVIAGGDVTASYSDSLQKIADAKQDQKDLSAQMTDLQSNIEDASSDRLDLLDKIRLAGEDMDKAVADAAAAQAAPAYDSGAKAEDQLVGALTDKQRASALASAASAQRTANNSVTSLTKQLREFDQKVAGYQTDQASLAGKMAAADKTAASSPVSILVDNLRGQVDKANQFRTVLGQLKAQGLDNTTYAQLVGAGVDQGLSTAQALAADGTGAVAQIASLQTQLSDAGTALGADTSQTLFGAGVAIKQGIVDGLTADMSNVNAGIAVLKDKVTIDLYQAGLASKGAAIAAGNGILEGMAAGAADGKKNSALDQALSKLSKGDILDAVKLASGKKAKSAGENILEGLRKGLDDDDKNSALDKTLKSLGKRMVKTLQHELGIKSPSTKFANMVGKHIPTGVIKGIDATAGALDARVSDLVSIPALRGLGGAVGGRGGATPAGSYSQSASVVIHGNVGWDPEEVADRMRDTQNNQAALSGLDALVPA